MNGFFNLIVEMCVGMKWGIMIECYMHDNWFLFMVMMTFICCILVNLS